MLYRIKEISATTLSTGTKKGTAVLTDVEGKDVENVTLWPKSWPQFDQLKIGDTLEGDITVTVNGKYTNSTLFPSKKFGGAGEANKASIAKAQEVKKENIKEAQASKDESIKTSSTFRDATSIALEFYKKQNTSDIPMSELAFFQKWLEVRKWLIAHYGLDSDEIPF